MEMLICGVFVLALWMILMGKNQNENSKNDDNGEDGKDTDEDDGEDEDEEGGGDD